MNQQSRRWHDADCFEATAPDLRAIIRAAQGRQGQPSAMMMDGRTFLSNCESGLHAGYDDYKRKHGSKVHMAVCTLGDLLAVHVTPADEQGRAHVRTLCEQVQQAADYKVELALGDQGYTGGTDSPSSPGQWDRSTDGEAA